MWQTNTTTMHTNVYNVAYNHIKLQTSRLLQKTIKNNHTCMLALFTQFCNNIFMTWLELIWLFDYLYYCYYNDYIASPFFMGASKLHYLLLMFLPFIKEGSTTYLATCFFNSSCRPVKQNKIKNRQKINNRCICIY